MARSSLQADTALCPLCGSENLSYAAFCISCGESFYDLSPAPAPYSAIPIGSPDLPNELLSARTARAGWSALHRRETWLGALLIIALLGYVVYEWGRGTAQSNAYREGLAAVQRRDWDLALERFGQASDLRDAQSQAGTARNRIAERDQLYSQAVEAGAKQQWRTAITALQSLQLVQPGYRDSKQRLSMAEEAAFRAGLEGLVYLVSSGDKPGLYLRDGSDTPRYLPGSDQYSLLRASSDDGLRLAYDVPASALASLPLAGDVAADLPGSVNRLPILAHLTSTGQISLVAAPGLDPLGSGTFIEGSATGIWWRNSSSDKAAPGEVYYFGPEPESGYAEVDMISPDAYKLVQLSDLKKGKRVVAYDKKNERVVWAQGDPPGEDRMRGTLVFIARADGQGFRYLMAVGDEITRASFNREGTWLLLTSQRNSGRISQMAWLVQVENNRPGLYVRPRLLEQISWGDSLVGGRLTATFVPGNGPFGAVLVRSIVGDDERLTLYDPGRRDARYELGRTPEGVFRPDRAGIAHSGDFLASRRELPSGAVLELVKMPPASRPPIEVRLPAYHWQNVDAQFSPHDDYVLATVRNPEGIDRSTAQVVYVAKVEAGGTLGESNVLAIATLPFDSSAPSIALPGDGTLLAFVGSGQQLKAASLDRSSMRYIASGVSAVWSLGERDDLQWRR